MKISAIGCCPCSWPYFLTLSYISGRSDHSDMEERPALPLPLHGRLCSTKGSEEISPSDGSVKSPNASTDSGFEGENHRPTLLQTSLPSPCSKDMLLGTWRSKIYCDGTTDGSDNANSPKSPKKSADDSDFNESPFDKKCDGHLEYGEHHTCTFFTTEGTWVKSKGSDGDEEEGGLQACCTEKKEEKMTGHVEFGECLTCHRVHYIRCQNCMECSQGCSQDVRWGNTLESIGEPKGAYAENSEEEYDEYGLHGDGETDTSDDRGLDGTTYSDETLSAYYVPSNVSVSADEYHLSVRLPEESKRSVSEEVDDSDEDRRVTPCLCHIDMCKSERCRRERAKFTTVLKPKAVRPAAASSGGQHRGSLESLHSQHVVAVIGQRHDRLSAFHERPASSLSQGEVAHYSVSLSQDVPQQEPRRSGSARPSITSESVTSGEGSQMSTVRRNNHRRVSRGSGRKERKSSPAPVVESPKARCKRFSMPWELFSRGEAPHRCPDNGEPIHMTLEEVHSSLHTLHPHEKRAAYARSSKSVQSTESSRSALGFFASYLRQRRSRRDERAVSQEITPNTKHQRRSLPVFLRSAFSSLFGLRRESPVPTSKSEDELRVARRPANTSPFTHRALPPLPGIRTADDNWPGPPAPDWSVDGSMADFWEGESEMDFVRRKMDYAASIERVKDCGWYWGPISGETAERLLSGEPDGSFVVRDSSDEHYIFSLTFKLNGLVRHVRIEHDHGNFSFGCLQKFRSSTIVDFIDSAVAHSRSGRYLFFLHRRPVLGPMRVQLLHPVSRFKQVQSLQHMCRFVILKTLRRDLIEHLPLPRCLKDYLNTPHYYSEELANQSLNHRSNNPQPVG